MIIFLTGDNSYQIHQEIKQLVASFDGEVEKHDGSELSKNDMANITQGQSLFSSKKLVIIRELSDNKQLWEELEVWLERLESDTTLVLVESKPDKRTKAYKLLQQVADTQELITFSDRDSGRAEQWLQQEASQRKVDIDKPAVREMVARLGVDQWTLSNELNRLSGFKPITKDIIANYTPQSEHENVFRLLEIALNGDVKKIQQMVATLSISNDPYMTFGLLSSQLFSLSALVLGDENNLRAVAKDTGQKEFMLSKLKPLMRNINQARLKTIISELARADKNMKSTATPWRAVENFLLTLNR